MWEQLEPHIRTAARKAQLTSAQEVLCLSAPDLQRLTGLGFHDVQHLLNSAALTCRRFQPITALQLQPHTRLGLGCPVLTELLRGGLPAGGITELSGESGAGKTQLALQLCLAVQFPLDQGGLDSGALYISTEDSFPIKRLQQMISQQPEVRPQAPPELIDRLGNGVYVEHAADLASLQVCLARRAPLLLAGGRVRLLVLDSLAALFRAEFQASDWLERSKQLIAFSSRLRHLSREYNAPVLCINQVRDVFDQSEDALGPSCSSVSPALGLNWASQVLVRLMLRRLASTVTRGDQSSTLRRLEVVFAPHLPRGGVGVAVWKEGILGV